MTGIVSKKSTITAHGVKAEKSLTLGYIIYFLIGTIEILLIFRLAFKIMGANPYSGFVNFIYSLSYILIVPFTGIFRQATTQGVETTAILEPATIVAMIVYAAMSWGIIHIVMILSGKVF